LLLKLTALLALAPIALTLEKPDLQDKPGLAGINAEHHIPAIELLAHFQFPATLSMWLRLIKKFGC
jgi:hypothetical protein